mgnify:CR=1 FL=1
MLKETLRRNKGITLIALVVTIIVLLILAGISIAMLTGQNGILNRASEAQEKTGTAQTEELVKLSVTDALTQGLGSLTDVNLKTALNNNIGAGKYEISGDATSGWTVTVDGKEFKIDSTGKIGGTTSGGTSGGNQGGGSVGTLPTGGGTTPYLPNSTFSKKEGDLSTGLVIKDSNDNEYVWVEVPTTIYSDTKYNTKGTPSSADDWEKIRDCLKAYTSDYSNSHYKDTNTDGTTYSDDYKNMLKSVYTNGGFWIGRYEAGLEGDTPRKSHTEISASDKAVVKQNKIPYNYVTRDEAQTLAERMNYDGVTSSLIYGVQWDLILKFIETKNATTKANLTSNSTTIGNYNNNLWNITNANAKYSTSSGNSFTACPYEKTANASALLTTGADTSFSLMNIYDVAGNVWEWTKEFYNTSFPCVYRGGSSDNLGSSTPAKDRGGSSISLSRSSTGFRFGLWK